MPGDAEPAGGTTAEILDFGCAQSRMTTVNGMGCRGRPTRGGEAVVNGARQGHGFSLSPGVGGGLVVKSRMDATS